MHHEEAIKVIHDLMRLCNKVMVQTISGYDATYASILGKSCKEVLDDISSMSEKELNMITENAKAYTDILNGMLA